MIYNVKRALGFSLALYVSTFVVGIVCGMVSGQDMSSFDGFPDYYWYVGMVAAVVLTAVFAKWYFKSPSIHPSAQSGFWFGLTAVMVSFVLDYALFSLGNMGDGPDVNLGEYYGDYRFWIIIVLVILTAKLIGHMKGSKKSAI